MVKNAKGETTDMTHVVERVESNDAVDSAKSGGRAASIKKGLLILVIVAILAAIIYYFVQVCTRYTFFKGKKGQRKQLTITVSHDD